LRQQRLRGPRQAARHLPPQPLLQRQLPPALDPLRHRPHLQLVLREQPHVRRQLAHGRPGPRREHRLHQHEPGHRHEPRQRRARL
ncbi:hypothetical protein BN1708_020678, partial [Verticillium longisporum]